MKIKDVEIESKDLEYKTEVTTAHGANTFRRIWILKLTNGNKIFEGEISPLTGFGDETESSILSNAEICKQLLRDYDIRSLANVTELINNFSDSPCFKSGLEQALLQMLCFELKVPINQLLHCENLAKSIQVNCMIGINSLKESIYQSEKYFDEGFRSFKLKIGREKIRDDIQFINWLHDRFNNQIEIRLDCNQGLSFIQGTQFIIDLKDIPIAYIEEPLQDATHLKALKEFTSIPFAADESLYNGANIDAILSGKLFNYIIIKPGVMGGIINSLELINKIKLHKKQYIVTSSMESPLGMRKGVIVSALSNSKLAAGLNTLELFDNIKTNGDYEIKSGRISIGELVV